MWVIILYVFVFLWKIGFRWGDPLEGCADDALSVSASTTTRKKITTRTFYNLSTLTTERSTFASTNYNCWEFSNVEGSPLNFVLTNVLFFIKTIEKKPFIPIRKFLPENTCNGYWCWPAECRRLNQNQWTGRY